MYRRIAQLLRHLVLGCAAFSAVCGNASAGASALDPEIEAFMEELAANHHFDRRQLRRWFSQARVQGGVLNSMTHPATARPWHEYRATHVNEKRIRGGLDYWLRHAATLARASIEYGVPEEIVVATIGVETFYGKRTGNIKVFDALVTLAFAYPPRAELFRSELEQFLLLTRELRLNPLRCKGSYAGALGVPQFLPSSYRRLAVDFDNDGRRDLWNHSDAIGSIANYYKTSGWQTGAPVIVAIEQKAAMPSDEFQRLLGRGVIPHTTVAAIRRAGASPTELVADEALASVFTAETATGTRYWIGFNNFYVITRYNRSINYALAVHELAQELRRARHPGRFE